MRDLVYYIAITIDGFIAREDGSFSEFPWDEDYLADMLATYPETFPAHLREGEVSRAANRRFDAVLMGRKTYEVGLRQGITSPYPTLDQYVFSHTMRESPDPSVTLISQGAVEQVAALKSQHGGAIWICGGAALATTLHEAGLVDEVIVKVNPILFGTGVPLFTRPLPATRLERVESREYATGQVVLSYAVRAEDR